MTAKIEPVNLGSVARGALLEYFNLSAARVAANIADPSTPACTPREIILKIKLTPEADRRGIDVVCSASCKLAATSEHKSRLYSGKGTDGKNYLFDDDPRQELLFPVPEKGDLFAVSQVAGGEQA